MLTAPAEARQLVEMIAGPLRLGDNVKAALGRVAIVIHHPRLDDGRERGRQEAKERAAPLPKECPSCQFLKPAKVTKCPACGFKPEKQSDIQCDDGDLVEMTPRRARAGVAEKESLYGQLKHFARTRNYSEGWVAHKFKALTGVWPDRYLNCRLVEPSPFIRGWIKSQQIAWVKSKGSAHAHAAE